MVTATVPLHIERDSAGVVWLHGELTFSTVPRAAADWAQWARSEPAVAVIDLGAVERADSAGLAWVVACLRSAEQRRAPLRLRRLPPQILALAELCGVLSLIPVAGNDAAD